ncbi:MAG TPA: saccharopine dehydrogenase NADP-binding domain-containing protein [Thermoanaerobaculia bacterium]|nr:saccharopine dehydrogenase NADP-binding domain-containing protein [Thermoanaerobaculia bacterium]
MSEWMIYGANGYTGELIAREAARLGLAPVLAGRNAERIRALAAELRLESRVFDVGAPQLSGISLVLHCAGPFSRTSRPMVDACVAQGAHYLDITGEIPVFEAIMAHHDEAKSRGVTLLPGVGFDVVPTDCLAAMLAQKMPAATELWLAFYARGSTLSRGTLRTMLDGIGQGGAVRRDGRIIRVPPAYDAREIPFSCGARMAMTIPWGDVSTAFHTTGIPDVRVYAAAHPKRIARLRRYAKFLPLLARPPLRPLLGFFADRKQGPTQAMRKSARTFLWGRVEDSEGNELTMTMSTPEPYALTVSSALAAVERVLREPVQGGSFTPAKRFGARFVLGLPGVEL